MGHQIVNRASRVVRSPFPALRTPTYGALVTSAWHGCYCPALNQATQSGWLAEGERLQQFATLSKCCCSAYPDQVVLLTKLPWAWVGAASATNAEEKARACLGATGLAREACLPKARPSLTGCIDACPEAASRRQPFFWAAGDKSCHSDALWGTSWRTTALGASLGAKHAEL